MATSSTQKGHNGTRHNRLSSSIYFSAYTVEVLAVPLTVCVRVRELVCFMSAFLILCSLRRNGLSAPIWRNSIG